MVFRYNRYGRILPLTEDEQINIDINNTINQLPDSDQGVAHTGGIKELWEKIKRFLINCKMKAAKALGLADKISITSILNRLQSLASTIADKIRTIAKDYAPRLKSILDTISNAIMDAIDYIKDQFS